MTEPRICHTVAELIEFLGELDPNAVVMSHEPPFTGVYVVPQSTGQILIASLHSTDEGKAYRDEVMNKPSVRAFLNN